MTAPRPPCSGQRLGRYLLLDGLSRDDGPGLAARTFHALDLENGTDVALAIMQIEEDRFQDFLVSYQHARRQGRRVSLLPTLLSAGVDQGRAYLVTRRVAGPSLATLSEGTTLPMAVSTQLLWTATLAVSQLHGSGLVHGNVHPGNLRVTGSGDLLLVGHIPRPLGIPAASQAPQQARRRYAPPEFYATGMPTSAGDVFSLGLTALELLAGPGAIPLVTVAEAPAALALLAERLDSEPALARAVPVRLKGVLQAMLSPRPEARPGSGTALLRAVQEALPGGWNVTDLPTSLRRIVPLVAGAARSRWLAQARQALASGHPLTAAGRLLRAVEGGVPEGAPERHAAQELLLDCAWSSFVDAGEGGAFGPEQRSALLLLLLRANQAAGTNLHASLLRQRLSALEPRGPAYEPLLLPAPNPVLDEERREAVVRVLHAAPASEVSLLALAVLTPDLHLEPDESLHRAKAALLERYGVLAAALMVRSRELAAHPQDPALLADLADLAARAAGAPPAELAEDPARPPSVATTPGTTRAQRVAEGRLAEQFHDSLPPTPVPVDSGAIEEADIAFLRGQVLVQENKLAEAAGVFHQLLEQGVLHQEHFYSAICAELRTLMWKALLPSEEAGQRLRALRRLWDLTLYLELETLMPLADSLLLAVLPEPGRLAALEELLEHAPHSVTLRQAAAAEARVLGAESSWAEHLVEAGFLCLERWDLAAASRLFLAAKTVLGPGRCDEGMEAVMETGRRLAEASLEFRRLEHEVLADAGPDAAFEAVHAYLKRYPYFRPAMERGVSLAEATDRPLPACLMHMALARDALLRESTREAHRHLRDILTEEFDNDEALLYLASLDPPGPEAPRDVPSLRIWLLRREGLVEAATAHALRELQGGQEDVPYLEQLVEMSRGASLDATPHRIALGRLAMEREDLEEAREQFRRALEESRDLAGTVGRLVRTPGVWRILRPGEFDVALGEGDEAGAV